MRVLLDENVPVDLASLLDRHNVETVSGLGWDGVKNGELLLRMRGRFDALLRWIGSSRTGRTYRFNRSASCSSRHPQTE
jgi:hypothetical protein